MFKPSCSHELLMWTAQLAIIQYRLGACGSDELGMA